MNVRAIRIYQPGNYTLGQEIELNLQAMHHVAVVLRMQVGDKLILFCGDNREFDCVIEAVKKKQVIVKPYAVKEQSKESPLSIHLAQAVSKGDRMDTVMQKSVELGVSSITPLITSFCAVKLDKERMDKKLHQWQSIVIAACEQSGRNVVPKVYPPVYFDDYVLAATQAEKLILHPAGDKTWRDYSMQSGELTLVVGPEGGLSDEEVKFACQQGFLPLSLGPRILRTETAAITALSVLQAVFGDL